MATYSDASVQSYRCYRRRCHDYFIQYKYNHFYKKLFGLPLNPILFIIQSTPLQGATKLYLQVATFFTQPRWLILSTTYKHWSTDQRTANTLEET